MDLSALTLTQLRYLLALDAQRSFRAAADACHVSQPALSAQIARLEELLGTPLFDRSRKPIVPTEAGARIIPQARAIVQETDRLADLARTDANVIAGRYRLGVIPTLASTVLPRVLPTFCREFPDVELIIEEHPTQILLERLAQDLLDGGIAATPLAAPGIQEQVLFREPFYAYLPAGHALLKRSRVRQSDLRDLPMWLLSDGHCFREQVLQLCGSHCPVESPAGTPLAFDGGAFQTLIDLVDNGLGATIIPELCLTRLDAKRRRAHCRPFSAPIPVREVSLLFARRHLRRRIGEKLAETIVAVMPEKLTAWRRGGKVLSPLAENV